MVKCCKERYGKNQKLFSGIFSKDVLKSFLFWVFSSHGVGLLMDFKRKVYFTLILRPKCKLFNLLNKEIVPYIQYLIFALRLRR